MKHAKRTLAIVLTMALCLGAFALSASTMQLPPPPSPVAQSAYTYTFFTPGNEVGHIGLSHHNVIYDGFRLQSVDLLGFVLVGVIWGVLTEDVNTLTLPEGGAAFVSNFRPVWRDTMNPPRTINESLRQRLTTWDVPGFGGITWSSSNENVFTIEYSSSTSDIMIVTRQAGLAYLQLTLNDYPITIQQQVTVTPSPGGFASPEAFSFDPHVMHVNTGETASATLSFTQNVNDAIPAVRMQIGTADSLILNSNPEIAIAQLPELPDNYFEQFAYYREQYIAYLTYLYYQGMISETEGLQRLEQFEQNLTQDVTRRFLSSIEIIGISPGRAVISVAVGAIELSRGELVAPWGAMYFLEVIVSDPTPSIHSWDSLRTAINDAPANTPTPLRIGSSFSASDATNNSAITIPANRDIILLSDGGQRVLMQPNADQRHFIVNGNLTLGANITLSSNAADDPALVAGGVQVGGTAQNRGTFILDGGTIRNNRFNFGGGVDIGANGSMVMRDGFIVDNYAQSNGGGVRALGAFTMYNGRIERNAANSGGGVLVNAATFTMHNGRISNNTARGNNNGGGVVINGTQQNPGNFVMHNGIIEANNANNGGGVNLTNVSVFTMRGGEISNNTIRFTGANAASAALIGNNSRMYLCEHNAYVGGDIRGPLIICDGNPCMFA